jgi:hypothetical protein
MKVPKKVLAVTALLMTSPLWANEYKFKPADPELSDLPHQNYYTWGVKWALPAGETIKSATLTFSDIYDWTVEQDRLYVNLLDSVPDPKGSPDYQWDGPGHAYKRITIIKSDNQNDGDNFKNWSGNHVALIPPDPLDNKNPWWDDPVGGSSRNFNLVYNIDSSYFDWFSNPDGGFGFGIDPDCHYFNSGITFTIVTEPSSTSPVPVPAAASLAAIGLAGLAMVIWGKRFLARSA